MNKEMKRINQVLMGKLSDSIYEDTDKINRITNLYNETLEIKTNHPDAFVSTHESETVISPVVFKTFGQTETFDLVFLSMAPSIHSNIHLEKQAAGERWVNHYNFYNGSRLVDYVSQGHLNEYTNMMKLLYTLKFSHPESKITIEDILNSLSVEKEDLMSKITENHSVMMPYLLPFHSKTFETNMNGINELRKNIPAYDAYLEALLALVYDKTDENSLIVGHGFSVSQVTSALLVELDASIVLENGLFSILNWNKRHVLLFNDLLFSRRGLRSDVEIDQVVTMIKNVLFNDASLEELNDYCNDMIDKRQAEDFKNRGKRINGGKVKGIAFKKAKKVRKTDENA